MRNEGVLIAMLLGWVGVATPVHADVTALAPFDVTFSGGNELVGIAVTDDGTRYVSDRAAGAVYRISPTGVVTTAANGLDKPAGLALDAGGRLLIAEEHAGRVLRLEPGGALTPLTTGIRTPRWIVANADGSLYVSAHRLTSPDGPDTSENRTIVRLDADGSMREVATGIIQLQALGRLDAGLIAASKGLTDGSGSSGVLLRFPVNADGSLGAATTWVGTGLKQPIGLALDALGSVFVSSKELTVDFDVSKRAIGKVQPDVHINDFAASLSDPEGLALGPDGALYLADGHSGRLYRFRPPGQPTLDAPPEFTNQPSAVLSGATDADARVDVFTADAGAIAFADANGRFAVTVPLDANVTNVLTVFATAAGGDGLTSSPVTVTIVQDSIPPSVTFQAPPEGALVAGGLTISAQAVDTGSGVATMTLSAAGQTLTPSLTPPPPARTVTATATWETRSASDGVQTLRVTAGDRAGNQAPTVVRSITIDNTPPETTVTSGPTGATSATSVTFAFEGTDNLTPSADLVFAWRLDDKPFTAFTSARTATLDNLATGPHTFQVKSRDRAGNEDPTPASQSFIVGSALRVTISDPAAGAALASGMVVVRGIIDGATGEVGVTVNDVAGFVQGSAFAALVQVTTDTTTMTAVARTVDGAAAAQTIAINVAAPATAPPAFRVTPTIGPAPLTVTFSVGGLAAGARITLDADGDGSVDIAGPTLDALPYTFSTPGVYVAIVTITDAAGLVSTARAAIQALDSVAMDVALRAKWATLRSQLAAGNIEGALAVVADGVKPKYRSVFTTLAADLPSIAADLRDVQLFAFEGSIAEYATTQDRDGGTFVHFIYFMPDTDGVWKIVGM